MKVTGVRSLLLAGTGLALLAGTPAMAQQQQEVQPPQQQQQAQEASECLQRLDQIEQQLAQAEMAPEHQADVQEIVQGARTLAEQGDEQGCMSVVAELEQVVVAVEDAEQIEGEPGVAAEADPAAPADPAVTEADPTAPADPAVTEAEPMEPAEPEVTEAEPTDPAEPEVTEAEPTDPAEPEVTEAEPTEAQPETEVTETEAEVEMIQPDEEVTEAEPTAPADPAVTEAEPMEPAEPEVTEAEPAEPAAPESPLAAMSASDLIGSNVVNEQGDSIAEIVDIVTDPTDEQMHAVLSVGGFLGIGAREVAVPLDEFEVGPDDELVLAGMTEDALQQMPEYDETRFHRAEQPDEMEQTQQEPAQQ